MGLTLTSAIHSVRAVKLAAEARRQYLEKVQKIAAGLKDESSAEKALRIEKYKADYKSFVEYYFPQYASAPCAQYHVEMAMNILRNKKINQFNIIHRYGAKSTHANLMIPLWLMLIHDDLKFMVLIGINENAAKRLMFDIKTNLVHNQRIIEDFGEQKQVGDWADTEFRTKNGDYFLAMGIDQPLRGLRNLNERPRYISVDDIDDRRKARNQELVMERVDRIEGAAKQAFGKDYKRLVISNNYIHKKGTTAHLVDRLKHSPRTRITWRDAYLRPLTKNKILEDLVLDKRVNITFHEPGARLGDPAWRENYDRDYWAEEEADTRPGVFEREFFNNPIETGRVFLAEWIRYKPMPVELWKDNYSVIVGYGDLSYRKKGDHKAIAVLGYTKKTKEYHLLAMYNRQSTLDDVADWMYRLDELASGEGAHIHWYVESNFIQSDFLDAIEEYTEAEFGSKLEVSGDPRQKGNKYDRIEKDATTYERGHIHYNELERNTRDMEETVYQYMYFAANSGYPDDGPDAIESARFMIKRLLKKRRSGGFATRAWGRNKKRRFGLIIPLLLPLLIQYQAIKLFKHLRKKQQHYDISKGHRFSSSS